MSDYISREEAMKVLCRKTCHPGVFCPDEYCIEIRDAFKDIPAADVIPLGKEMWLDRFDIQTRHWRSEDGQTVKVSFIINRSEEP